LLSLENGWAVAPMPRHHSLALQARELDTDLTHQPRSISGMLGGPTVADHFSNQLPSVYFLALRGTINDHSWRRMPRTQLCQSK
jgi:hypothetical protein